MTVKISGENAKLFENNGFTKEQIGETINNYRNIGFSDEEIQDKINSKISEFESNNLFSKQQEVLDTADKALKTGQEALNIGGNNNFEIDNSNPNKPVFKTGVQLDITPSGLMKAAGDTTASLIAAPVTMQRQDLSFPDAFKANYDFASKREKNPFLAGVTDIVGYLMLPEAKVGNAAGNFALNAGIQGGIPFALESLKEGHNPLKGFAAGSAVGAGLQAALPPVFKTAGKGIQAVLNNPNIQRGISNTLEFLTSVPAKFSDRALKATLAGKNFFANKFNPDTAYRPVEAKLREAKNSLPNTETFKELYKNLGAEVRNRLNKVIKPEGEYYGQLNQLGKKFINNIETLETITGDKVNQALQNLPEDVVFKADDLAAEVNKIFGEHSLSGVQDLNPARNTASRELQKIDDLLYGSQAERVQQFKNEIDKLKFDHKNKEFVTYGANGHYGNMDTAPLNNALIQAERDTNTLLGSISKEISENPELLNNDRYFDRKELNMATILRKIPEEYQAIYYEKLYKAFDVANVLNKENMIRTPKQLYDINSNIKGMINWNDTAATEKNRALERLYGIFSNKLSELSPELKEANKIYSYLMDLEKTSGGINESTIGQKLADYGNKSQILSGADKTFQNIDNLLTGDYQTLRVLPEVQKINQARTMQAQLQKNLPEGILNDISKYNNAPLEVQGAVEQIAPQELKQYQDLLKIQQENADLIKTIGPQYERKPRLLSNRTDENFENALNLLQEKTGINFMDELYDIRAREALEKWMPGQGGGSGSEQGIMNNVVRPTMQVVPRTAAAAIVGSQIGGPLGAGIGLFGISPKFMAKGTIKNIGKLNNYAKNMDGSLFTKLMNILDAKVSNQE